jgi:hypothetical protein
MRQFLDEVTHIAQALDRIAAAHQKGFLDYASTVAVSLTFIVLFWYTVETSRLRKAAQQQTEETHKLLEEAQRQNEVAANLHRAALEQNVVTANLLTETQRQTELSVMPVVVVYIDNSNRESKLILKNVGSGAAFNVRLEKVIVGATTLHFVWASNLLASGESYTLTLTLQEGNRGENLSIGQFYQRSNKNLPEALDINIQCMSMHRKDYAYVFKCRWDPNLTITYDQP